MVKNKMNVKIISNLILTFQNVKYIQIILPINLNPFE